MKEKIDVLLINPPIGTISTPYISIPLLASYLKKNNIKVKASDMNREFLARFVKPGNLKRGEDFAGERFMALNGMKELNIEQMFEYSLIHGILKDLKKNEGAFKKLFLPFSDFSDIQSSDLSDLLVRIASLPYFPESILTRPGIRYLSRFYEYSTKEIIESTRHDSMYSDSVKELTGELLSQYDPLIVGISVTFQNQVLPAFLCAGIIKELNPAIHVTLGGTVISIQMRELKDTGLFEFIDSLVLDEGEIPLIELYKELKTGKKDLAKVPGLVYPSNNKVIYNPPPPPLDLEKQEPPDYSVFNLDGYLRPREKMIVPFRLSKGCYWQKCTFCRTELSFCRNYQQPSFEFIYRQLKQVIEQTGIKRFIFSDESADPELLAYISRNLIKDKIKIDWFTHSRVDKRITKEYSLLFKEAGCLYISLGVESFNNRLLKLIKKGITAELSKRVIEQIDGALMIGIYMMVGIPSETEAESREGFEQVKELVRKKLIGFYAYNPVCISYGSDMWLNPGQYGIKKFNVPGKADLFPDVYDFESTGMDRQKSHALYSAYHQGPGTNENTVTIGENSVELNFDINAVNDELRTRWEIVHLPFSDWHKLDEKYGQKVIRMREK